MRVYKNKYLSVTSVLSLKSPFNYGSFKKWCEKNGLDEHLISSTSSLLGEKVSRYIEDTYNGLKSLSEPCVDYLECRLREGVESFLKEYEVEAVEQEVYCEKLHYAGRFDGVIKRGEERYLADWKTYGAWKSSEYKRNGSKIKRAREQLSLYSYALGWEDKLAVVVFRNDGKWELEELEFDESIVVWVEDNQDLILETIKNENEKVHKEV